MRINLNSLNYNIESLNFFDSDEVCPEVKMVFTINSEFVLKSECDSAFYSTLKEGNCSVDGRVLQWILYLNTGVKFNQVSGSEILPYLEKKNGIGKRVYLLGGDSKANDIARLKLKKSNYSVASFSGNVSKSESEIVSSITDFRPDYLFVALGAVKQELFISENKKYFDGNVGYAIGCGGSIDMFGGKYKRAPRLWQVMGLESFYRLFQQPSLVRVMRIFYSMRIFKYVF